MRIMIADDHPLFAEGLRNLLRSNEFEIVEIVKDGENAIETACREKPDVILMDIGMPVINGIEATCRIKEKLNEVKIIILTSFEEEESLIRAVKAGASGYLLKSLDGKELIEGLRELEKGKNPFSPGLEDFLLNTIRQTDPINGDDNKNHKNNNGEEFDNKNKQYEKLKCEPEEIFSDRQLQVIRLLVKGFTYQEIGDRLFLSERTIKYHMEQIKKKLDLKTQAQVIACARDMLEIK
ncbi:MAG: response regulator [Halanaerobiaceae bacterium]